MRTTLRGRVDVVSGAGSGGAPGGRAACRVSSEASVGDRSCEPAAPVARGVASFSQPALASSRRQTSAKGARERKSTKGSAMDSANYTDPRIASATNSVHRALLVRAVPGRPPVPMSARRAAVGADVGWRVDRESRLQSDDGLRVEVVEVAGPARVGCVFDESPFEEVRIAPFEFQVSRQDVPLHAQLDLRARGVVPIFRVRRASPKSSRYHCGPPARTIAKRRRTLRSERARAGGAGRARPGCCGQRRRRFRSVQNRSAVPRRGCRTDCYRRPRDLRRHSHSRIETGVLATMGPSNE